MTEESFSDLFQDKKVKRQSLKPGDKVQATIAGISGDSIFLDIGGKSEGVLNAAELRQVDEENPPAVGDTLNVYLLAVRNGELVFTTKVGVGQASLLELEEAFKSGIPVQGKIKKEIKGGFEVQVAGQRAFCPYSQVDIRRVDTPEAYLEKTLSFKIIELGAKGKNIIVSARAVLEEQREEQRKALQQTLHESMQVSGTVTSLRDFGAFVDLGGVDGLIPISELTWGQVDKVEDVLSVGQQVTVIIKKLDWANNRISLSLKETTENPWVRVSEKYPRGTLLQGSVSRLTAFGAFITLEPGVDGLLHISKLGAGRKIHHPREILAPGQTITVKVEKLDTTNRRISLEPADYQAEGEEIREENKEGHKPEKTKAPRRPADKESAPGSMGTLGDLLKSQMRDKKNR